MEQNPQHRPTSPLPTPSDRQGPKPTNSKLFLVVIAVLLIAVVGCIVYSVSYKTKRGPETTVSARTIAPAQVSISSSGFMPATITVKVGQAVVWTNKDSKPHVVASDPYPTDNTLPGLNSEQHITSGEVYSYIFKSAGTYTYHDNLNPSMSGTVIVGSATPNTSAK